MTIFWNCPSSAEVRNLFAETSKEIDTLDCLEAEHLRKSALASAKSLVAALERPEDTVMRYVWEVKSRVLLHDSPAHVTFRTGHIAWPYAWVLTCKFFIS